jgi:hypothetical protein
MGRELDLQNLVWYSVVGKSLRFVMAQRVRHLATSLLKSSNVSLVCLVYCSDMIFSYFTAFGQ